MASFAVFDGQISLEECRSIKDDLYDRVIPALDPDVIVAMNLGYEERGQKVQYRDQSGEVFRDDDSPEYAASLETTTSASLAALLSDDRKVVVLEPVPWNAQGFDPLACLADAEVVEECRYVVDVQPTGLEELYRRLDEDDERVWSLDLDGAVCPFLPICDPIVDGQIVRWDGSHLTRAYARELAPVVGGFLASNGIVP